MNVFAFLSCNTKFDKFFQNASKCLKKVVLLCIIKENKFQEVVYEI